MKQSNDSEKLVPLNQIRTQANLSLQECAAKIQVSTYYLAHIENQQFDKLPKGPYSAGYLKKYCHLLNIDAAPYLQNYAEYCATQPEPTFSLPKMYNIHLTSKYQHKQHKTFYGLVMAFILFLGFGVIANQDLLLPEFTQLADQEQKALEVAFSEENKTIQEN